MGNKRRVLTNTIALYLKMIYAILISLYTTRVVLEGMGVVDYGIYILVAGVISLLGFLNVSMTIATQRFMSIAIGQGNFKKVKKVFESSVFLHLVIGLIIVLFLEICGIFLFDTVLNIPEDRIPAAKLVYQFMIVSTFFTINAVPYDAAINANEDMWVDSIIGFFENTLKMMVAIYLLSSSYDELITYSLMTALIVITIRIVKTVYCRRKYMECRGSLFSLKIGDKQLIKEMSIFAGWNTFGSIVIVSRSQLISVLLNLFYGTVINAAYGVANQINAQLTSLSSTLLKAINPQIVKSEGGGDRIRMLQIANYTAKFSFFLFSFALIPLLIETPFVLEIWLKKVPEHAIIFTQLLLISTAVMQLSNGIMISMQSVGKLKVYTIVINCIYLANIPIAWLLLKFNNPPHFVLLSSVCIEIVALIARVFICKKFVMEFQSSLFFRDVVGKSVCLFLISYCLTFLFIYNFSQSWERLFFTVLISSIIMSILIYFISFNKVERNSITIFFKNRLSSLRK